MQIPGAPSPPLLSKLWANRNKKGEKEVHTFSLLFWRLEPLGELSLGQLRKQSLFQAYLSSQTAES